MHKRLDIGFLGFGEAAQAFASGWREQELPCNLYAYDVLLHDNRSAAQLKDACRALNVQALTSAGELRDRASIIISVVTADQVIAAASSVGTLPDGILYLDANSAAPTKKQVAAKLIGDGYLDVSILSPVLPRKHAAPILFSGVNQTMADEVRLQIFPNSSIISDRVGDASQVKMIRSVFVKGLEAITVECVLSAHQAGLTDRIFPSLDLVLRHNDFASLARYNMERVTHHGVRRAAEMEEVCATLDALNVPSDMSQSAAVLQRKIGALGIDSSTTDEVEEVSAAILGALQSSNQPSD